MQAMSRQQDKVLRAMISLREFTASQLEEHSEVEPATIRTVLRRFQNSLAPVERVSSNGRRGGQPRTYRVRPDRMGHLIDKMLVYTPLEGWELSEERRRLLDLSVAHESLVKIFGQQATPAERRQLLKLVEDDIEEARAQLASLPKDDREFARYAHRIEEVNLLFLERRRLLDRSEETEGELARLEQAVEHAGRIDADGRDPATVVVVDAGPEAEWFKWGRRLCRELDREANTRTKLVSLLGDPKSLTEVRWDVESIAGCIMTVDSSSEEVNRIIPAVQSIQRCSSRLMPILIVDAHQNLEFKHVVFEGSSVGFYIWKDFLSRNDRIDANSVLQLFSMMVRSLRMAHHLVCDRTVHEAGRSVIRQLMHF